MTNTQRQSIGREKAILLEKSKWWESLSNREIAEFQLFTIELCMPFSRFHEAVEKSLGRSVMTHEFGLGYDGIVSEFLGNRHPPTMEQITDLIPKEKQLFVSLDFQKGESE